MVRLFSRPIRSMNCEATTSSSGSISAGSRDLPLKPDDSSSNRHRALSFCLSMIFFGKPVSTFPDHALGSNIKSISEVMTRARPHMWAGSFLFLLGRGTRARARLPVADDDLDGVFDPIASVTDR